jgi:hypothetical protein
VAENRRVSTATESEEPRTVTKRPHLPASVISAEDAPAFWRVGILWNISLSAETTAGEFTMMDQVGHDTEQQTILADAGAAVWIPRGTPHAFEVKSETARALNFYTPGGFDESISMLATPAAAKTLPPADSGESDPRGFRTDPAKEAAYHQRIAELHSQSMP